MPNMTTITSLKTYLYKVLMKLLDYVKLLDDGYHRALHTLFRLKTVIPFVAGVLVTLGIQSIVVDLLHIQCDSGLGWEGFHVTKNGEAYCFIRQTAYPHKIMGGRI